MGRFVRSHTVKVKGGEPDHCSFIIFEVILRTGKLKALNGRRHHPQVYESYSAFSDGTFVPSRIPSEQGCIRASMMNV